MNENHEPSVLDYLKSLLIPGRKHIVIPPPVDEFEPEVDTQVASVVDEPERVDKPAEKPFLKPEHPLPWLTLLALLAALIAQFSLEPRPNRDWVVGALFYGAAAIALVFALLRNQFVLADTDEPTLQEPSRQFDRTMLGISLGLAAVAFLFFGSEQFTTLNTLVWVASIGAFIFAVRSPSFILQKPFHNLLEQIRSGFTLKISAWTLLLAAAFILSVFFRVYQFNEVPSQMVSDHAEKLYDVADVLDGQRPIFFTRNTGREAFQFYWTAFIADLFNTGISFVSLKIGTVVLGILILPFLYLLGKELGSRLAGLFAMLFAGIAYWPNVISRVALRFTLYPFFFAPTLYFFLRGMRTQKRRDFVLSGLFLGLGLHGYTPFRVVPLLIVLAIALYLLHNKSNRAVRHAMIGLLLITMTATLVAIPLIRYGIDNPDQVLYRTLTRVGSIEQELQAPALEIFLKNLWGAMTMFAWDNGEVWVISVPHRPALDAVSGALYYLGFVAVLVRYIRRRKWTDLLLLISIPILMLPSIFSLAFPSENPSLNRTAGAIIPVFLLIGFALEAIYNAIRQVHREMGPALAGGLAALLIFVSASLNYNLVFNQYRTSFDNGAWNSSQIGGVVEDFVDTWGNPDSAFVVGYPHWVDTRLVGVNAGTPDKDYAIFIDQLPETLNQPNPKLFVVNVNDTPALESLMGLYPNGIMRLVPSQIDGREFYIYFVAQ
ncbi:MAG: ArnT family glycosyltransferase [Bellilinea sp.]